MIGYVTEQDYIDYAAGRGVFVDPLAAPVQLTRALDYIELQPWPGAPTDPEQPLEWPRNGAEDVPAAVLELQMAAALVVAQGGDLFEPIGKRVTQESVGGGAVSVSYSDRGPLVTTYPQLSRLIAKLMGSLGGTNSVRLVRG